MDAVTQSRAMRVAATHAAKQAIELVESIATLSEKLPVDRLGVDAVWARGNIRAIRAELDDLEHLLEGRQPPVPVAPKQPEAA